MRQILDALRGISAQGILRQPSSEAGSVELQMTKADHEIACIGAQALY